jgi:hypothetical protein
MAYVSQELKASLAPAIKAICKKYGVKGTLSVDGHSTLCLNLKSGKIDFIGNGNRVCGADHYQVSRGFTPNTSGYEDVNTYHYKSHYDGKALAFLKEVIPAMNNGNHDNSDTMTDYFDVGWYIRVNIGRWNQKYVVEK